MDAENGCSFAEAAAAPAAVGPLRGGVLGGLPVELVAALRRVLTIIFKLVEGVPAGE